MNYIFSTMLKFYSASTSVINTQRAVLECLEIAMGNDYSSADLLIFHCGIGHDLQILMLEAKKLAPGARVVASSAAGVVGREGVFENSRCMALMAIVGKEFSIASCNEIYGHNSFAKTTIAASQLRIHSAHTEFIYFLASGVDIACDQSIKAIEDVFGEEVTIFGATSSDNMVGAVSYQGLDGNVYTNSAILIGFFDQSLSVETQASHGFRAIGFPMLVTKCFNNIILELDGKPAWEEYTFRLGLDEKTTTCADTIPIGALAEQLPENKAVAYGNSHILRVVTKKDGAKMFYPVNCKVGDKLWLTVRDEELIFNETIRMTDNILKSIANKQIVAIFHADCLARGRYLFGRVLKEELVQKMQMPFSQPQCPPWLGMYGFGEFARLGNVNTFHNYTTALFVITRK